MMSQFVAGHPTDGMDEIPAIKIFKPVLIRVMSVGLTIEVMSRRVFNSVLVASILKGNVNNTCNNKHKGLTRYSSSLYINGVMAHPALV